MKKTTLILSSSLFSLCAMAVTDINGIDLASLPTKVDGVYSIVENTNSANTPAGRYVFEMDDLMLVNKTTGARHLSTDVIIDTNGKTGLQFVSDAKVNNFAVGATYNYLGFNGVNIVGGGEISFSTTEQATPIWFGSFSIDGTTVNMNVEDKILKTGDNKITITNGAIVNWNSSTPTQKWSQVTGQFSNNDTQTTFTSAGSARNTLNFMSGALTYIEGVGDVLYNFGINSLIDVKFDQSLGDDIIVYNSVKTGLVGGAVIHLEKDRKITYQSAINNVAAIRELKGKGSGTFVFDFDGTMAGAVAQTDNNDKFTVEIESGRNVVMNGRYGTNSSHLTLNENATLYTTPQTNTGGTSGNNHLAKLTMKTGSQFTVEAGLRFRGGDIDGDIIVNGSGRNSAKQDADDFMLGLYGGDFVFRENATLSQAYLSNGALNWTYITKWSTGFLEITKLITNSAKGSINLGNKLAIARGTTFVMNTTDAYIIGSGEAWNATSQATSVFNLIDYFNVAETENVHTRFEINAANNIGAISFDVARVVEIAFGENGSLVLGEEAGEYFNSLRGNYLVEDCILLDGLVYEQLKIYDFSEEDLKKYFSVLDSELYKLDIKAVDGEANAFWVNTVAVPEPAEWAMIFGAIALGFVAYRRRK